MAESNSANAKKLAAVVLLIAAAIVVVISTSKRSGSRTTDEMWFYDVDAAELFSSRSLDTPPIKAPSGGEGVRAYVFSCGDCASEDQRFIAYLQKWPAETLPHIGKDPAKVPANVIMDQVVAKPGTAAWHYLNSPQGQQLVVDAVEQLRSKCPSTLTTCRP